MATIRTIPPNITRRVLLLALPHRTILFFGFVALTLASGLNLLFPYLIGQILNQSWGLTLEHDLPFIVSGLIGLFVFQATLFYLRAYYFQVAGYKIVSELRKTLYDKIITQDVGFFDSARIGDLLSRLNSDTQLLQRALTVNFSVALRYLIQVLGGIGLMFFVSFKLTIAMILLVPIFVLASVFWGKRLRTLSKRMQEQLADAAVVAEESFGAVRTVKIFAGSRYESGRHSQAIDNALLTGFKRSRISAVFTSTMVFVIHSSIAIILWIGGSMILKDQMTIGDLTTFLLYAVIVAVSFGFLANVWDEFMQAVGGAERIFELIDAQPKIIDPTSAVELPANQPVSVRFDNVSFAYPSRPESVVLNDISFEIPAGSTVALVGPSGAGKSYVASLIPRFYDVTAGQILFCEKALNTLSLESLRARISLVEQDAQVFSISIRDNIAYAKLTASQKEIEYAATAANLHDFILSLPKQYDTLVGQRGVQLSGGQRQRLTIARALLKDPKFLILDEATSALDSENEHLVQQALQRLMANRTTLVIAHRLSTVQHADQVLVLRDGKIVQQGTHHELVKDDGLYRDLVEYQLL